MLGQIAFGSAVSLANIAVHAMAMVVVIRVARNVALTSEQLIALANTMIWAPRKRATADSVSAPKLHLRPRAANP